MQEKATAFNRTYGFRVVLIPIRAARATDEVEDVIEIVGNQRTPLEWRFMPGQQVDQQVADPHAQIHLEIERQIERIDEERLGDLFLSDSQRQVEKLRETGLFANEFLMCYLTLTMLVPTDNPHQFDSVRDVLESNRRLGIMKPSLDGLGEASWTVLSRIAGSESAIPMDIIQLYERQYDLLEALEQQKIDAALVWNATSQRNFLLVKYADEYNADPRFVRDLREATRQRNPEAQRHILREMSGTLFEEKSFAEEVPLTKNPDERFVVAIQLVALSSTADYGFSERFVDFMRSNQGREILRRFGFIPQ